MYFSVKFGRRHCAGGSAPCSAFYPRAVQCQNVGYDGLDVQWECKTDMDGDVRSVTVFLPV